MTDVDLISLHMPMTLRGCLAVPLTVTTLLSFPACEQSTTGSDLDEFDVTCDGKCDGFSSIE